MRITRSLMTTFPAGNGLYEQWRLYLSGITFEAWGSTTVKGYGDHLTVKKYWNADKTGGFAVGMLPGTKAMLVTIKQWGSGSRKLKDRQS